MTREYQFEVDFACSLWFAISFLTVLVPLVVPDGAIGLCLQLLSSCSAFLPIRPVPFAIFAADANACVQRTISHWPKPIDCIWASLYLTYFFGGMLTYILIHNYECGKNRLQRRANHELSNGAPNVADYTSYEYTELANG